MENFVYSYQIVPWDSKNLSSEVLISRRRQETGEYLWRVHKNGDEHAALCRNGVWCMEPASGDRNKKFYKEFRFKTIEDACKAFQLHLVIQKNPQHPQHVKFRYSDYLFMETEFSKFLNTMSIRLEQI